MARQTFAERRLTRAVRRPTATRGFLVVFLGLSLCLAAPSVADDSPDPLFDEEFYDQSFAYPDPFESSNRGVFAFNRQVDRWVLDPVTKGYRWAVPKPARSAISRVFLNLASTKTIVNDFLQLEWRDFTVTTTRFVVNTTVGIVGLFDVAAKMGLEGHESDFGQTLALAAVPSGPYLIFPVLGPANARDGMGGFVDIFFQPVVYVLGPATLLVGPTEMLIYSGSSGISRRDRYFVELKALEDSSVDFYAAMRSGYFQQRVGNIWGRRQGHRTSGEPNLESVDADDEEFANSF